MATAAENLQTRLNAIAAILAAGQTPDGQSLDKPTVTVDGETKDTVAYKQSLYDEMDRITALISTPALNGGVPWERRHRAR